MKKIVSAALFMFILPLIAMIFVKPDKKIQKETKNDTSVINFAFLVKIHEDRGDFKYRPENLVEVLMTSYLPESITFSESEDYVKTASDAVYDYEQEYLKALAIVMRTNLVYVWEKEGCPELLDFGKTGLHANTVDKKNDKNEQIKKTEIKRAVKATYGAVITKDNEVIAAPFFTSDNSSIFVSEAGDGIGFSLNFAYMLAKEGMSFYDILKYFFEDIKINIHE